MIKSHQFDISNNDESDDFVEMASCKYYSADEFKKEKFTNSNSFSVLHLNIHSMERHIYEFQLLFDLLKFRFDVLCFSESKIIEGTAPKTGIMPDGYQEPVVGMNTRATKGGVLMYVKNRVLFIPHCDRHTKR